LVFSQFTNSASATGWNWQGWSQPGASAWVSSPDAGGATPPGSLELDCNFNNPDPPAYQQVVFQRNFDCDPNRFVYLDMDLMMDPASYPMGNGEFPTFEVILNANGDWTWKSLGTLNLTLNNTNWTHLSFPIAGHGLMTNMHAITLKLGGGWDGHWCPTNTVKLFLDNIKFWTPQVSPTVSIKRSGPAGLEVTSTAPTDDWQRQNIVTPAGSHAYSWANLGQPVTYAFTITNYPEAVAHPGFEAHMYLLNFDTLLNQAFDETYPAVDWNARDLINVKIQNNGGGGVDFSFNFKTNLPGANVNETIATIHDVSALGRWAVTFANNTDVTMTTPSGAQTNFTISPELANAFAANVTLHFGTFKNRIINNRATATFSRIEVIGALQPIDETFIGPGLNPDPVTPSWRLAADPVGLVWVPRGTAWWMTWSLPDTGYTLQSSPTISGPWNDAGVSYIIEGTTSRSGAVPTASLPSPNTGFFRMMKPN
jgi:hypothetical protein